MRICELLIIFFSIFFIFLRAKKIVVPSVIMNEMQIQIIRPMTVFFDRTDFVSVIALDESSWRPNARVRLNYKTITVVGLTKFNWCV